MNVINAGNVTITGSISGEPANGSLQITSAGAFANAPDPTLPQADVTSIYSDFYTGVTGFNPGVFAGPNTSSISAQIFDGKQPYSF